MRQLFFLGTIILAFGSPALSSAQRVDDLPRGARVRLTTAGGGEGRGYIDSVSSEVIMLHVFERDKEGSSVRFQRDLVKSMEVMRKHTGKGALRGGLLGLLVGGGGGFLIGALMYSEADCDIVACSASASGAILGFLGAVVGTPLGLVIGAAHGAPEWRDVSLRQ